MKIRKTALITILLLWTTILLAVPAKRGQWQTIRLADGTEVRAELRGDEYVHYWQDESGRLFQQRGDDFVEVSEETIKERVLQRMAGRNLRRSARRKVTIGGQHEPFIGSKRGLIILVEFADMHFEEEHNQELYNRIANERGFTHELGFEGSVRDYFLDQSDGKFDLSFDVVGPVPLPEGYAYYGQDNPETGDDSRAGEMVVEACNAIADEVNFSDYDWDGDGEVDQVFILYAGMGQNNGGGSNTIWPHEWELNESDYGNKLMLQGVIIDTYACGNELQRMRYIDGIGTICHEFSHCLGLPDMYDTSYHNYGMGYWDLMDQGSYNEHGFCPAGYTSYERMYAGWKQPIELKTNTRVTGMRALNDGGNSYIIYNDGHLNEYYLLENRQRQRWDFGVPGDGLLIIHVDYKANIWKYNAVNNTAHPYYNDHQRCTPVSAYLASYSTNGDTYPRIENNSLTNTSRPAATLYHKNSDGGYFMNKPITDIEMDTDGRISFNFRNENTGSGEIWEEEDINHTHALFYESFNKCYGSGGNDEKWKGEGIGTGTFRPDNEGWESDYYFGALKCGFFGKKGQITSVTTPKFTIHGPTEIAFRAAPWEGESELLYIFQDEKKNLSISPVSMFTGDWNIIRATIDGEGETSLTFRSVGRFFLDDVTVLDPTFAGIKELKSVPYTADKRFYRLDGTPCGTSFSNLPSGIYLQGGRKVVKR